MNKEDWLVQETRCPAMRCSLRKYLRISISLCVCVCVCVCVYVCVCLNYSVRLHAHVILTVDVILSRDRFNRRFASRIENRSSSVTDRMTETRSRSLSSRDVGDPRFLNYYVET